MNLHQAEQAPLRVLLACLATLPIMEWEHRQAAVDAASDAAVRRAQARMARRG